MFGLDPTDHSLFVKCIFLQIIIDIAMSTLFKLEGKQVYYQLTHKLPTNENVNVTF